MEALIPVNIVLGDRTYRLKIEPQDEEMVRKEAKMINDKIIEFRSSFAGKDMQDFIAMVLIWYATEQHKNGGESILINETIGKLSRMEEMINKALTGGNE
ncbi:MAG: cell division protein ZapA [Panacibacter sp.]